MTASSAKNAEIAKYSRFSITTLSVGFLASLYNLYIDVRTSADENYLPFCDLSSAVSCSKALNSRYSNGFGIVEFVLGADHFLNQKNAFYGVIVYTLLALVQTKKSHLAAIFSVVSGFILNLMSCFMAYHLVFCISHLIGRISFLGMIGPNFRRPNGLVV
ncbi:unnamed protein product [Caenorhabditis auriculariae]|uniref:vitamin-K-epoxide reductase (warfarin-sensitive) n=1 Tax=Caenorhabditis auriculariae TaxID=2777116 RepID=A0A8S1GQA6_9PELO|nr:unnamed protein product [Caenorhabditis auriculariae]